MANCRSCKAEIIWVTTNKDKMMPLNATPDQDGNVEILDDANGPNWKAVVHPQPPAFAQGPMYMPHHATCPDAEKWRHG